MALEAKARIEIGELHTATLLATTTLGAVENLEGSEYSLETRLLCLEALTHAKTAQLGVLRTRTAAFVGGLAARLRSPGLRQSFLSRQVVRALLVSQRNEQATS
jgi:hypothetical protein